MSTIEKKRAALAETAKPDHVRLTTTRHGKSVCYFQLRRGAKATRMKEAYQSPEWWAHYHRLMAGVANNTLALDVRAKPSDRHIDAAGTGTVGHVARLYFASDTFERLEPPTKRQRRLYIETCLDTTHPEPNELGHLAKFGDWEVSAITRPAIVQLRGALPPGKRSFTSHGDAPYRDQHIGAMRAMFTWAVDDDHKELKYVVANPFSRIEALVGDKDRDGHRVWTRGDLKRFAKLYPLGSNELLWVMLPAYLGVRASDAVNLGAANMLENPGYITFVEVKFSKSRTKRRQQKTRIIEIDPDLLKLIKATPGAMDRPTFIVGKFGRKIKVQNFCLLVKDAVKAAGIDPKSRPHGLRHFFGNDLAMNGATLHEIAAALGHKSLKSAERYTKAVENMRLTQAALQKRPRLSL